MIGFIAQLVDGTLGMAYGVICSTFLRFGLGVSPLVASALVHHAEVFSSGASAFSHWRLGNVDVGQMLQLAVPGVIGGVIGALLLSEFGEHLKGAVSLYLIITGLMLMRRSLTNYDSQDKDRTLKAGGVIALAVAGGLLDAAGGGGWGPIVTTTLLRRGQNVAPTVGTVNAAEFFVTLVEAVVFFSVVPQIGEHLKEVICMILGGVCAAPLAAFLCHRVDQRKLLIVIGVLVTALNVYTLFAVIREGVA